jgi:hypothetical protein
MLQELHANYSDENRFCKKGLRRPTQAKKRFTRPLDPLHILSVRRLEPYRFTQYFHLVGLFPRKTGAAKMPIGG